jgi:hypothetical protein
MQTPNLPAIRALRPAWNRARIVGPKRSLAQSCLGDPCQARTGRKPSGSGFVQYGDRQRMNVVDVMASSQIKERASVLPSKTQKPMRFEISEGTRASVANWLEDPLMVGSEFLWPGRFQERLHISTRQYARTVRDWVSSICLEVTAYGTQSMRRSKGYPNL